MKDVINTPPKSKSHVDKGKVFFQSGITPEQDIMARAARAKEMEEELINLQNQMEERANVVKQYNNNINDHLEMYTTIKPTNGILVRLYLREPKITESGLFIPENSAADTIEVKRRGGSGDRYIQKLDESPWKWSTKAIVVAKPDYLTTLNVGDLVQVEWLPTGSLKKEDESVEMTFQHAYIHCDANTLDIPQDCLDPHFGYALIPSHAIKCTL